MGTNFVLMPVQNHITQAMKNRLPWKATRKTLGMCLLTNFTDYMRKDYELVSDLCQIRR
jgi:hypothetical protein